MRRDTGGSSGVRRCTAHGGAVAVVGAAAGRRREGRGKSASDQPFHQSFFVCGFLSLSPFLSPSLPLSLPPLSSLSTHASCLAGGAAAAATGAGAATVAGAAAAAAAAALWCARRRCRCRRRCGSCPPPSRRSTSGERARRRKGEGKEGEGVGKNASPARAKSGKGDEMTDALLSHTHACTHAHTHTHTRTHTRTCTFKRNRNP